MSNKNSDILFQLIKSLEKAEKRNFKLYIKRNSSKQDLKIIQLFDTIDKMEDYDEKVLLKKLVHTEKPQLANLKIHLYKELLSSLRLLKSSDSIELQLNEQLDCARILYNKGLYLQTLKILEKAKDIAKQNSQDSFLIQIISLEKKIETLHITRSMQNRSEILTAEANEVNERRLAITQLSNLALQLYSWFIKYGHAGSEAEEEAIKQYFKENLPKNTISEKSFYEQLYLCQSYCWYGFIRQDFLLCYRYSQKWVSLFDSNPNMKKLETSHYIKGFHNLLNAHFDLKNYKGFAKTLEVFEAFSETDICKMHENFRINSFIYIYSAKLNWHLMTGTFQQGLTLVSIIESNLKEYAQFIDVHRVLVFNYKIANLYFGSGNYSTAIDYLQRIINDNIDLRNDLQCYARILHLMAHYEMGNTDIIESLTKSVYRFMAKMHKLTLIEKEIFRFLRSSFYLKPQKMKIAFEDFLARVKMYEKNRFETRSMAYLDLISWLEGKVYEKPMSAIINEKYELSRHKLPVSISNL